MNFGPLVREILGSAISSAFDPQPIAFRQADEAGVHSVRSACQTTSNAIHRFRNPLNRNAFLCGCLDFTEHEAIEHLIVGFGHKHGRTTKVNRLAHVIGATNRVSIPEPIQQAIASHIKSDFNAEVLVFHNHPANLLSILFDNIPLGSSMDRQTVLLHLVQPLIAIKSLLGGGRVRYYLGENGFVREFHTPDLLRLLQVLSGLEA